MRFILYSIFSLFCFFSLAQNADPYAFPVSTNFNLGESHTYTVREFYKTNNQLSLLKFSSEVESMVSFKVLDTSQGGYYLQYSISVSSVNQRRDSATYVTAMLMDGMRLLLYAKGGHLYLDSTTYFTTKQRVANEVDSILALQLFGKNVTQYLNYLRSELKDDAGLGALLGPLMLYEYYYSSSVYKKFRINEDGQAINVLNKSLFGGIIEKQWVGTTKDNTVNLNSVFTGHPVQAANYFKSVYEKYFAINNIKPRKHFFPPETNYTMNYDFKAKPGKAFPPYLYKKTISEYGVRSVSKIEMTEVIESTD